MSVRVDYTDVQAILSTTLTSAQLTAFIEDASLWVDTHLEPEGLSAATLAAVEKYLAAHFATLRDPRLTVGRVGDVAETYQRDDAVSEYLKTAAALDQTGKVEDAFIGARPRAKWHVGEGFA